MLKATFFFFLYFIDGVRDRDVDNQGVFMCNCVCVCVRKRKRDCVFSNLTDYLKIHICFRPEVAKLQPTG